LKITDGIFPAAFILNIVERLLILLFLNSRDIVLYLLLFTFQSSKDSWLEITVSVYNYLRSKMPFLFKFFRAGQQKWNRSDGDVEGGGEGWGIVKALLSY
jgi:hypothetical protein